MDKKEKKEVKRRRKALAEYLNLHPKEIEHDWEEHYPDEFTVCFSKHSRAEVEVVTNRAAIENEKCFDGGVSGNIEDFVTGTQIGMYRRISDEYLFRWM